MKTTIQLTHKSDNIDQLYHKVSYHIDSARQMIQRAIDTEMVHAYWNIGKDIVEEEQKGQNRAEYGSFVIKELSRKLLNQYGKGFSVPHIKNIRQFYITYKDRIGYAVRSQSLERLSQTSLSPILGFQLGWIHYRALMRVNKIEARQFYEIEAVKNNWTGRELERQIGSMLFDRLIKSKDKDGVLKLANQGHAIESPSDIIKDPMILEFLNIPESHKLVESTLEEAIITNLQNFLLELGKGFAFVSRQKRLTFDGHHYYTDLVFYHYILKCYVIIDIKVKPLNHGDLGQMQLYVNYFDKEIKMSDDNPTIGLVLCTEKSDKMVEYTLGEKAEQIFATTYQLHLPTVEELENELRREIKEINYQLKNKDSEDNSY